jgi:hypothetical protein
MSLAAIRPRRDQVAELTRGLALPLPEVGYVHLEIIAEACCARSARFAPVHPRRWRRAARPKLRR